MNTGEMLASEKSKPRPLVHFYWLLRTPTAVNQPLWAGSLVSRLPGYLEKSHCGETIPPADLRRVYAWIDADVPYYGTYAHSHPLSPGRRDLCTEADTGRESAWFAQDFKGVYARRCEFCHGPSPQPNDHSQIWDGRLAWINFSRPQFSPALTTHLAKAAGGRGLSTATNGPQRLIFESTSEPDYQALLAAIGEGRQLMLAHPEADMPGFKFARKEP